MEDVRKANEIKAILKMIRAVAIYVRTGKTVIKGRMTIPTKAYKVYIKMIQLSGNPCSLKNRGIKEEEKEAQIE